MGMNNLCWPAAVFLMQFWSNPRQGHATKFRKFAAGLLSKIFVCLGLTQDQHMQLCSIFIVCSSQFSEIFAYPGLTRDQDIQLCSPNFW